MRHECAISWRSAWFAHAYWFGVTYFRFSFPPKFPSLIVPFEPKTDSKEFEIASLEQGAGLTTRSAASQAADLTIRILRRDASSGSTALNWNSESVLVYMIADLVSASHGRTAVEIPAAMTAHFDNSWQALVAAKRIQTAMLEFLSCRPVDSVGAAILIHPPAATGFSGTMAQSALRLAEPGQIILSQEVATRFQDLPGMELRAVPALTTGGSEHTGLTELIWASPERLASMRNTASAAAPTANLGASFGATMIVNTPLADPASNSATSAERSRDIADRFDTTSRNSSQGFADRDKSFQETLAEFEEHRSFITPLKMAVGAIAIVLLIVGLLLFHPWSGSKVQPRPQAVEAPTGGAPVIPERPAGNSPQPPPVVQPVDESHAKPLFAKPANTNKQQAVPKEKPKKPEDTPIQGFEGNSTYDGMTQKDIPRLLLWARSDAGNGNYAKAAQEYRVILQLQPNNPDAREGLRKIQVAQGHN